jgi:hypothetical protein
MLVPGVTPVTRLQHGRGTDASHTDNFETHHPNYNTHQIYRIPTRRPPLAHCHANLFLFGSATAEVRSTCMLDAPVCMPVWTLASALARPFESPVVRQCLYVTQKICSQAALDVHGCVCIFMYVL